MSRLTEVAAGWAAPLARAGLSDVETLLLHRPDEARLTGTLELLSKPGLRGRERWRWRLPPDDDVGQRVLYIKRYLRQPLRAQLDRNLRQAPRASAAQWEYRLAQRLAEASVPSAAPVAFAERLTGTLEQRSVLILEAVPGDAFERVWPQRLESGDPLTAGRARHDLTRRLARFISAFHGTGCCHRDLYLCHVFIDWPAVARETPRFHLIDLARVHAPRVRHLRWMLKDLSQLDYSAGELGMSRGDRYRFLLSYLGLERGAPRARWYARRILRRSRRIRMRQLRKQRAS